MSDVGFLGYLQVRDIYRKALIFRGLYISRINGKIRFREKYFRENRMKWYIGAGTGGISLTPT